MCAELTLKSWNLLTCSKTHIPAILIRIIITITTLLCQPDRLLHGSYNIINAMNYLRASHTVHPYLPDGSCGGENRLTQCPLHPSHIAIQCVASTAATPFQAPISRLMCTARTRPGIVLILILILVRRGSVILAAWSATCT